MAPQDWDKLTWDEQRQFRKQTFGGSINEMFMSGDFDNMGHGVPPEFYTKSVVYENEVIFERSAFDEKTAFHNCYFSHDVTISHNGQGNLSFTSCVFEKGLFMKVSSGRGLSFNLRNVKVKGTFLIENGPYKSSTIYDCSLNRLNIAKGRFTELGIGGKSLTTIEELELKTGESKGRFVLSNLSVKNFLITGINKEAELYLEQLFVNSFTIDHYRNEGSLRIQKIIPLSIDGLRAEFVLYDSILTNVEFYEINLAAFDDVIFHDTFLSKTILVGIEWPDKIKSEGGRNQVLETDLVASPKTALKKQKDTYRQIKYALSDQGDVINEHTFHALEMRAYDKSLDWSRKNIANKIVIKFSYWLSDFGQSIIRPLTGLLSFSALLYFLILFFGGSTKYQVDFSSSASWWATFQALADFVRMLNPLHRNEPEYTGGPLILDVCLRVWSSYMIYNLIRATRRFLK